MKTGLGICGGHRTGKTTLAQKISEQCGIYFAKTEVSSVFKKYELDPSRPMDFSTRLMIQQKILDDAKKKWEMAEGAFVTDRTPVDMMAYTLADIGGNTAVEYPQLSGYLYRCFETTNKFFSGLAVVQPGISLVDEPGKAALNPSYIEHLNALVIGLVFDERLKCPGLILQRQITDLADRVLNVRNGFGI